MPTKQNNRFREIRRILVYILILNWGVAAAKIVYGIITHLNSMTADGLHSLSDGVSNIIGIIGITIASYPADKDHPYGHKKFETLFSLAISALLLLISGNLCVEGIRHLAAPEIPRITLTSFIIMLLTTAVNISVMTYEYRKGIRLKSDILVADSLHTKADIATSLSVIIALIAIKAGYPTVDAFVTLLISLFIAYSALLIFRQGAKILCDTAAVVDNDKISKVVLSVTGVKSCHKIRTRGREDDIYVDLHVQVHPHMHMNEAHRISHQIEQALKKEINGIVDVVVHMEPLERNNRI